MANTYTRLNYHVVFSTKRRQPTLQPAIRERLYPYFAATGREKGIAVVEVGGVEDHVHLLIGIPAAMAVAKGVQLLKGNTSRWLHNTFGWDEFGCWQEGYGAFSIGSSQIDRTVHYIRTQEDHHRQESFEIEYIRFLDTHGIEYDPKYVFD